VCCDSGVKLYSVKTIPMFKENFIKPMWEWRKFKIQKEHCIMFKTAATNELNFQDSVSEAVTTSLSVYANWCVSSFVYYSPSEGSGSDIIIISINLMVSWLCIFCRHLLNVYLFYLSFVYRLLLIHTMFAPAFEFYFQF
jgi:hypothetical protein